MQFSIAMVALADDAQISVDAIAADLRANWPDLPPGTNVKDEAPTWAFDIGESFVAVAHMPAPIPWSDLEGPCATSWLWPGAADVLKRHSSHLIVTVAGEAGAIERARLLTQVTGAILGTCQAALGVYWGNATLVISPEVFRDFAVQILPQGPPVHIWVDFRAGTNNDGTASGFTTGLAALGLMELETVNARESPGELRERFVAIAGYLLDKGPVIRDGDTVGGDANEHIRVVYSTSAFGHAERVMRLDYGSVETKKPWWKVW